MNCQAFANNIKAHASVFADKMLAMDFSNWLLEQLQKTGWNQSELASHAGVTRTAISDVISGRRKAGSELCIAISQALKLPPETVFRYAGLLPPIPPNTEQKGELLYLFEQLPENQKQIAIDYIRFLVEKMEVKNHKY